MMNKGKIGAVATGALIVLGLTGTVMCTERIPAGYVGIIYNANAYQQLLNAIGDLKQLQTGNKQSLVDALNEVLAKSSGDVAADSEVGDMLEDVFGEEEESVPDDQVATDEEVEDMLESVFGRGEDSVPEDQVATDTEVSDMLDSVFCT